MNTANQQKFIPLISLGIINGFIVFIFGFTIISTWQRDGFDMIEVSLLSIIIGLLFFIEIIISNIIGLNRYIRSCLNREVNPIKRVYQAILVLVMSFTIYLFIDILVFLLIDDSIPTGFANSLKEMGDSRGERLDGIEDFHTLPFSLQTGIITLFFGIFGSLISLIGIKKDGKLIP